MKKILPIIVLGFLSGIAGSYFHTKWNQTNWESDASIFTVDHISEIQNTANLPGSGKFSSPDG
jgi:hypothetical protein